MNETKEKFKDICRKILNAFTYPSPMSYTPDQAVNTPYPSHMSPSPASLSTSPYLLHPPCTPPPRLQTPSHNKERDKGVHDSAVALVLCWRMMMAWVAAESQNSREVEVEEMCRQGIELRWWVRRGRWRRWGPWCHGMFLLRKKNKKRVEKSWKWAEW